MEMNTKIEFVEQDELTKRVKINVLEEGSGELLTVSIQSESYLETFLKSEGVSNIQELVGKDKKVYSYKDKNGVVRYGFEKPFPSPSEIEKAVVTGTIKEVLLHQPFSKIALILENDFVVIKNFSVFNKETKKSYVSKDKKERLLNKLGISSLDELQSLVGKQLTAIRLLAGTTPWYDVEVE
ncbi:MAG: hypothetical protein LBT10_04045 [Methanobrevibacter sp.]|jgi:hypothetical protein|nr:hypothetical protein [Methanobrevibacter sp.]